MDCCRGPLTVGSAPTWAPWPDGNLPREATWRPLPAPPAAPPAPGGWLAGRRPRSRDWVWASWGSAGWGAPGPGGAGGWQGLAGYESEARDLGGGEGGRSQDDN